MHKLNNVLDSERNATEITQFGWYRKDFAVNNFSYFCFSQTQIIES